MKNSAGLVIIKRNKILLGHPTNAPWTNTYSFPKGNVEIGESNILAAIRETLEEVGITISDDMINKEEKVILYTNKEGKVHKRVFYFVVNINNDEIPDVLPKEQLQIEEVDWAGFLTKEEAETKIFWRFKPILDLLK